MSYFQLEHVFSGHQGSVYTLANGPEPHVFFSAGSDRIVAQWDSLAENRQDGKMVARATDVVYSMRYLAEDARLLIGQAAGFIHVVELNKQEEVRLIQLHGGPVFSIVYCDRYHLLATVSGDGTLALMDAVELEVQSRLRITDKKVRSLAFHPTEDFAIAACGDGSIVKISIPNFKVEDRIQVNDPDFSVNALAISPCGNYFLSGGRDAMLNLFEVATFRKIQSVPAHNYAIYSIGFDCNGRFATASRDKTVKLWDFRRFEVIERLEGNDGKGHANSVNALLWLPDGSLLSAGDDRSVRLWTQVG